MTRRADRAELIPGRRNTTGEAPYKSLLMIPAQLSWALIEDGWCLRNRIVWHKVDAMLYRLCRDLADILAVRDWCQQHQVKLRVLSGALSGITNLAATDATTTMLVSVGQFQRDLQNELTREGLAATWANGSTSGRRPRLAQLGATDQARQAYRDGTSIAALAREHGVSRGAIRTAVADLLPNQPDRPAAVATTEPQAVRVEIPGKIARHLTDHPGLSDAERHALRRGHTVRRGQGYSLHVTALPDVHTRHCSPPQPHSTATALPPPTARRTGSTPTG
jgi:transposase-like protein